MTKIFATIFLLQFFVVIFTQAILIEDFSQSVLHSITLPHSTYLDAEHNTVLLKWAAVSTNPPAPADVLVVELTAPTRGYIGFGISPNGGMRGSDIILSWVDDVTGRAHAQDRYAELGNAEPTIDPNQSAILACSGEQNATHTTVRFARLLKAASCVDAARNRDIEPNALRIIYSYSDKDPTGDEDTATYHGPVQRGTVTLYLLDDASGEYERDKQAARRDTTKVLQLKANNYKMPTNVTRYQVNFYQLPTFVGDVQILGFEPIIDPNNLRHVHHMSLQVCDADFNATDKNNTRPFDSSFLYPDEINLYAVTKCFNRVVWVWGVGGQPFYMPRDVGLLWNGEKYSRRWLTIETHYNNPQQISGMHDNSGMRVLLREITPLSLSLRPQNAAPFYVNAVFGVEQLIPPHVGGGGEGEPFFTNTAICTAECTQKFIRAEGVTLIAAMLHAHTAARSIVLRHYDRDGKELAPVVADTNYDFNYQTWRPLNVTLLPGDTLVIDCNYTTTCRNTTTFGGPSTFDEMCFAFLYATPPAAFGFCSSRVTRAAIADALLTTDEQRTLNLTFSPATTVMPGIRAVALNQNNSTSLYDEQQKLFREAFVNYQWNATSVRALQKVLTRDEQLYYCADANDVNVFMEDRKVLDSGGSAWKPFESRSQGSCQQQQPTLTKDLINS